ncbi:phosphotransferase [Paenibacillus nasutitermitis]|uniref:Aminoglycoside phosphotransferase domain-containing protein n=1 Tax=Paenibacillus nasutitermitis TaxID=1652958 RepID=A0A917E2B7_9BACL|nr:phosphotransferase [Paenibacillus nasutitermitis]GGD98039.1 hypothetical protein GCM10010911_66070 [Paenibacillus nasutitermitis]
MNALTNEQILSEVMSDIEEKFGWKIINFRPCELGYANLKWIIDTDHNSIFVKQYNKIRYRRGLDGVKEALKYQHQMYLDGIPCQPLYSLKDEYILTTPSGENYMITGVSQGKLVEPGKCNANQMFSLGEATGRMHAWMESNMPRLQALQWELPSKANVVEKAKMNLTESLKAGNERYSNAIEKQLSILETLDIETFEPCNKGWTHWDMHVDNLMFYDDGVADILDFDRLHFVFPDFDVSRAILSGAVSDNGLNKETTNAFIAGYRSYSPLTTEQLVRSIKLTWFKESKWIDEQFRNDKAMSRFIDEMIWIGEEWGKLTKLFNSLEP